MDVICEIDPKWEQSSCVNAFSNAMLQQIGYKSGSVLLLDMLVFMTIEQVVHLWNYAVE